MGDRRSFDRKRDTVASAQAEERMGAREGIERVVVLMLENRSFDCMFGVLYPKSAAFEGLSGKETNPYHKPDGTVELVPVWNDQGMDPVSACIPDPDPGELFKQDMDVQLFGLNGTPNDPSPPMNGFVDNYMRQPPTDPHCDPMAVMHYFTPKQVPVISTLAKAFGVCDQWHASAPCQTWPNRFFAHTATAGGYSDNSPPHFPYLMPSVFRQLGDKGRSWRVYFHDLPQAATLADLWFEAPLHFRLFEEFEEDARNGNLPNYSFVEPRYFTSTDLGLIPSDQHPPHNMVYGEQLVARVYNAVRSAPTWKKTLLVITYDEHGGCYDHMPPPRATPPSTRPAPEEFGFDRYGVRVPAVIISPYMPPGSIVRSAPAGLPQQGPPYPFDHTSIIATIRKLFHLSGPLTQRDAVAPDLLGPLSLNDPDNDGPASVAATSAQPSPEEVAKRASAPPNHMQKSLCEMASHLPAAAAVAGAHVQALASGSASPATPPFATVEDAASYARDRVKSFFNPE
jgi:phospholipase C